MSTGSELDKDVDLSEAKKWCDEARKLLGGSREKEKPAKLLDQRAAKIMEELKEMRKELTKKKGAVDKKAVDDFQKRFITISTAINKAATSTPPDQKEIERQSDFLSELKKEMAVPLAFFTSWAEKKLTARQQSNEGPSKYVAARDEALKKRADLDKIIKVGGDQAVLLKAIDDDLADAKSLADRDLYDDALVPVKRADDACDPARKAFTDAKLDYETERDLASQAIEDAKSVPNYLDDFSLEVQSASQAIVDSQSKADAGKFIEAKNLLDEPKREMPKITSGEALYKKAYTTAIKQAHEKADESVANSPGPLKTKLATQFNAFTPHSTTHGERIVAKDWTGAKNSLTDLKSTADLLNTAVENLKNAVSPYQQRLTTIKPKTDAADATGVPNFIQLLQDVVKVGKTTVTNLLTAFNHEAVETPLAKLELDATKMMKAKTDYKAVIDEIARMVNTGGEDAVARAVALDPPTLATARNTGLTAARNGVQSAADGGMIAEANRRIATWKTQANGWKNTAATTITNAQTALTTKPFDPVKFRTLISQPGGPRILDDLLSGAFPDNKVPKDLLKVLFKERYGVTLELTKNTLDHATDKGSKSVKKLYDLMAQVPDTHAKQNTSLKKIVRNTTTVGSGSYSGGASKQINLECGRQGVAMGNPLGDGGHFPDLEDDCKPAPGPAPKFFDWTTLHEIGHAVDDKLRFMQGKLPTEAEFGGWINHARDATPAATAARNHFVVDTKKFPLQSILDLLTNPPAKPYDAPPDLPDDTVEQVAWNAEWRKVVDWCFDARAASTPWYAGARAKTRAIDGRVYHESYADGRWASYLVAARSKGIKGYQFRAPGEWFADLYAAYHCGKLKPAHPAVEWLKNL
ncbi:MAG: hypothetical protein K8U03_02385 [Planctomycetia bacterium]|nr:hypothetical protein [Planctomycetia bacterium]